MPIEFYDVRKREKVQVPESAIRKVRYERQTKAGGTSVRYALKAELEGSKMNKFVSKEDWEALDAPVDEG
jgi:type IV secretory pathway VirD2 relaxase